MAQALAEAKSRQGVPAALKFLHADMLLKSPFGTSARGVDENKLALTRFFLAFPDYVVELKGRASDGYSLVCWGTVLMTMTGDRFGVTPNGNRAKLPVFIEFTFKDELIASERFFLDLSQLCAQSGVSLTPCETASSIKTFSRLHKCDSLKHFKRKANHGIRSAHQVAP